MREYKRIALMSAILAIVVVRGAHAEPKSYDYVGHGQWEPTTKPSANELIANPVLDRAEQLLKNNQADDAKKLALNYANANKEAPDRDRALYLIALAEFANDDRIRSYYYLDELMDEYPASTRYYIALQKQYDIGEDFLNGHKLRFLGLPMLDAQEEGVEILYRLQARSPGSPLAEKALLRTADYYFAGSQFDLAKDAYASYIRSYSRSPNIPRVKLRRAFSSLAEFRGLKYDPTGIIDARAELLDIARDYPDLAKEENVQNVIARIDSAFAGKILATGAFYERTHEQKAAVYHYRYLIETYPNLAEADVAKARLAKMPAWALTDAPPPVGEGYAPATQPSADAR